MSEDAHISGDIKWHDGPDGLPIVITDDPFPYYQAFIMWELRWAENIRQLINYAEALINQGYKE